MAYFLGVMAGATIWMFLSTRLLLWLLRKKDLTTAHIVMVHVGLWLVSSILYGFGNANGGSWNPGISWITYGIPTVILCVFAVLANDRRADEKRRHARRLDANTFS